MGSSDTIKKRSMICICFVLALVMLISSAHAEIVTSGWTDEERTQTVLERFKTLPQPIPVVSPASPMALAPIVPTAVPPKIIGGNGDIWSFVEISSYGVETVEVPVKTQLAFVDMDFPAVISSVPEEPVAGEIQDAPAAVGPNGEAPVDFQADNISNDEANQIVRADGNVVIKQAGRTLTADMVSYDLQNDLVRAEGNVRLKDMNGDIHEADTLELRNKMKDGFVEGLRTMLADGSRFKASEGERVDGTKTIMQRASYTPCEICRKNPERSPVWQISASRVTHHEDEARISYKNATFDLWGVPVLYTPYFSHADGTVDRKSGFVSPALGYKSRLGGIVEANYYWSIAPDKDLSVGMRAFTKENPVGMAEWRQRWEDASLILRGSITSSERVDSEAGLDVIQEEEVRGHIEGEGIWNIDNKWRAGVKIDFASDDQYLRQYDLSSEDVLENELYLERFSGRNYAAARLLAFKDVRIREEELDQPNILPEITASFKGEPWSMPLLGGRWDLETSFLGVQRSGGDQDLNRLGLDAGWYRRFISDFGLIAHTDASLRYEAYNTRDRAVATAGSGRSRDTTKTRFFPQLHFETSYPMVRQLEKSQVTVEPVVAVTAAPNVNLSSAIPNEDSQDVQIDASNLFEPNRFPGLDRIEDQSRVTYGLRSGVYGFNGSHASIFVGQSYRLEDDDNPFPQGSGLDNQSSDIVGQVSFNQSNNYVLDYRFQLDSRYVTSQRHEVGSYADFGALYLASNYLFAKGLEGTEIEESREQIQASMGYYFTDKWRGRLGVTQDLGAQPGLRKASIGLDYFGQCTSWALTGQRNLTDDNSGDSSTEVLFRIGLRNLGGFEKSKFSK